MIRVFIFLFLFISCAHNPKQDLKYKKTDFDKKWNYSHPVKTRKEFNKVLLSNKVKDKDYNLQLQTQIARTYSLSADFKKAHDILDKVKNVLDDKTLISRVRYHLERGRTFNSSGNKEKAQAHFIRGYEIAQDLNLDHYAIDAAHMMAIAVKDLDNKLKWNNTVSSLASDSDDKDIRRWIGVSYNNSGWDLFSAKRYKEALEYFIKSKDFYKNERLTKREDIAWWSMAKTYRLLGNTDKALKIQSNLLKKVKGIDKSGYTYEELGELFLLKGKTKKAQFFFSKAYRILSKDVWLQRNEKPRLLRLKKLSQ